MFNTDKILDSLNNDQRQAAINFEGPCFILAGPGSGKTHTIISRAAYMINQGVDPNNILLFTFTNKAAQEIKERVIAKIGKEGKSITMGTYHSICAKLLRKYVKVIGYDSNFSIYDSEDSLSLLKKICKEVNLDPKLVRSYISSNKNELIMPTQAYQEANNSYKQRMAKVYEEYQTRLFNLNAMDFDDLIGNMIKVLEVDYETKQKINNKFKYIIASKSLALITVM